MKSSSISLEVMVLSTRRGFANKPSSIHLWYKLIVVPIKLLEYYMMILAASCHWLNQHFKTDSFYRSLVCGAHFNCHDNLSNFSVFHIGPTYVNIFILVDMLTAWCCIVFILWTCGLISCSKDKILNQWRRQQFR